MGTHVIGRRMEIPAVPTGFRRARRCFRRVDRRCLRRGFTIYDLSVRRYRFRRLALVRDFLRLRRGFPTNITSSPIGLIRIRRFCVFPPTRRVTNPVPLIRLTRERRRFDAFLAFAFVVRRRDFRRLRGLPPGPAITLWLTAPLRRFFRLFDTFLLATRRFVPDRRFAFRRFDFPTFFRCAARAAPASFFLRFPATRFLLFGLDENDRREPEPAGSYDGFRRRRRLR